MEAMATVTLGGEPVNLVGELPAVGSQAPAFTVTGSDLSNVSLSDYAGKRVILNIFPSLDTDTCSRSVREFNKRAAGLENTVVLCISADLPFAAGRFCTVEGIKNVTTGSTFRSTFGLDYGIRMKDGALAGLNARSVVIVDSEGKVAYTQLVPETHDEPDYEAVFDALESVK